MPLLLRPSPVAGRALAWRNAGRDTAASPRALTPLAAVRHLFRDHSTDPQDGGHEGPHDHRHHPRRHPNHRKAPELSSDWHTLYLGSKLALWSGLCYFPYETIPRTLQEDGLRLVAYGRTSYTCWYVADGRVDFDALPHRAFPRPPPPHSPPSQPSGPAVGAEAGDGPTGASGGGTPGTVISLTESNGSSSALWAAMIGTPTNTGHGTMGAPSNSSGGAVNGHPGRAGGVTSRHVASGPEPADNASNGFGGPNEPLPATTGSSPAGHTVQTHLGARAHPHARGGGGGHVHSLRDGHIHLQREQPALHLRVGHGARAVGPTAAVSPGTRCRFIFLRGVQWAAPDTNTFSLSASLAAFWPSPLLPPDMVAAAGGANTAAAPAGSSSSSSGASLEQLVVHSGVGALARELMLVLIPHIRDAAAEGVEHLVFAGHSLGGSLAKLLWAMSILQGHRSPESTSCHTFGSPPVLAHAGGGGGERVLRMLRAPPAATINWVLEHDPVPRAMLTADPYFAAARRAVPGLSTLLALRGAVLGEGAALSSGRFLYETVGELLLLRWSTQGGCEVVPVAESESESLLQMALDEAVAMPVRSLQFWLDHHHASYHHDLETAALVAYRRQVRNQRADPSRRNHHQYYHHQHHQHHHNHHHEQQQQQEEQEAAQLQAAEAPGQEPSRQ